MDPPSPALQRRFDRPRGETENVAVDRVELGKELFYREYDKMTVVDVSTSPELVLSPPRQLFERRYAFGASVTTPNYDVTLTASAS